MLLPGSFLKHMSGSMRSTVHTLSDLKGSNIASTSSFTYSTTNSPLLSMQQLNVDWSKFENHTFFMSAEVNVNIAFERIVNECPFDGTREELEAFLESLTGFERWVYDQLPRNRGALGFRSDLGSFVSVPDRAGALFPDISHDRSGRTVIDPRFDGSLAIEMQLYLPSISNSNQIVCQKVLDADHGVSLHVSQSSSTSSCTIEFVVASGSTILSANASIPKGKYAHVCAVLDRSMGEHSVDLFIDEQLRNSSAASGIVGDLGTAPAPMTIGSGSAVSTLDAAFAPTDTLSGSIDEFRVWHAVRTVEQQRTYARRSVYASDDLKLYYRFNEPAPPLGASAPIDISSIVLDSSGNSLHAIVTNFTGSLRESIDDHPENPVKLERPETTVVLFPGHPDLLSLNQSMLATASLYDAVNPNLITKLIPPHYLIEGAESDGIASSDGAIDPFTGSGMPGQATIGSPQLIASFLYTWARMFDDMKVHVDAFRNVEHVDYETFETAPDNFLQRITDENGFYAPTFFRDAPVEQYVDGGDVSSGYDSPQTPLKSVQQELLRRLLINMPDIVMSKGTLHSVKSFIRSMGVDPDNSLRIREKGGPTERALSFSREIKQETSLLANFSSSTSFALSPPLTASRLEVGYPEPAGAMVMSSLHPPHGISNDPNDGLLTSGSWSIEGIVKFSPASIIGRTSVTQSLARLCASGTNASSGGIVFNLVAISSSLDPRLILYGRPGSTGSSPTLAVQLPLSVDDNVFNGERWSFSFGRRRNDDGLSSAVSSSYFVRIARAEEGNVVNSASTSSFFWEKSENELDAQSAFSTASGSPSNGALFMALGPHQPIIVGSGWSNAFLNDTAMAPAAARALDFNGALGGIRFWSRSTTDDEWNEHVRNHRSLGTTAPAINYNFVHAPSGSFERLRLDTIGRQLDRSGTLGAITFLDLSLNGNHLTGTGFVSSSNILIGDYVEYSYLSPYFDEAVSSDKVRVRGYQDVNLVLATPWAEPAPAHEIRRSEAPTDDVGFSIDLSLIDALNRDIVNMFATFDALDNALGDPALAFSPDYPDLDRMRDVYFNRLQEKLNFKKFFMFWRWFQDNVGIFVDQLLPRKTLFGGTAYSVESHMLERHKVTYLGSEQYLGDSEKPVQNVLLLQLIEGDVRKY